MASERESLSDNSSEDEGELCDVCSDPLSIDENPIVFCDGCDVPVHKACYGNPLRIEVPEGEWLCERCKVKSRSQRCCVCPVREGAMKRTTDGQWIHMACAMWIPEVFFRDIDGMEAVDWFRIPEHRWNHECHYCKSTTGVSIECSEPGCDKRFHIKCGQQHRVLLEYKKATSKERQDIIVVFCEEHTEIAKKQKHRKCWFYARK